jgi:hypothetical protein
MHSAKISLLAAAFLFHAGVSQAAIEITDPAMPHDFGRHPVGATYPAQYISVFNRGSAAVILKPVQVLPEATATCLAIGCGPSAPAPFTIGGSDGCSNITLQPGQGCSVLVGFSPYRGGPFEGEIVFSTIAGETVRGGLKGAGRDDPADCLFDWAERTYPTLLTPATSSIVVMPFYGRCYANDTLCVATDIYTYSYSYATGAAIAPPSVYLYQGGALNRLGYFDDFVRAAGCGQ